MEWHFPSLLTFMITGLFAALAMRDLIGGRRDIILTVYPVHFLLCGVPPMLDWVIGKPLYYSFPGLIEASEHLPTHLVYCLYVTLCPILWWVWNRRHNTRTFGAMTALHGSRRQLQLTALMAAASMLPFLIVLFAPDPTIYLSYTPYQRGIYDSYAIQRYHMLISRTTLFSVLAASVVLFYANRWKRTILWVLPIIVGLCWLHGKRNIVALAVAMLIFVVWYRHLLKGVALAVGASVLIGIFASYSYLYQTQWRYSEAYYEARDWLDWYENWRIDYGRDDVIKMAILGEMNPKSYRVLDVRGQSIVIVSTVWVPRSLWPDKPNNYPSHITELAMGRPSPGGGALTTSWLDEAISNFSWFAFLLGPLWIHWIAQIGNRCRSFVVSLITMLILIFIQAAHFAPWAPLFLVWCALVAKSHIQLKPGRICVRFKPLAEHAR